MAITHTATQISISGVETGDSLRSYMVTNSIGEVNGRNIIFDVDVFMDNTTEFSDNNCTWIFQDGHHINNTSSKVLADRPISISFEDASIIHYGSGAQSNGTVFTAQNITLIRTHIRIESATNRYDWFWQGITNYQMSNVIFDNQSTQTTQNPFVFSDGAELSGVKYLGVSSSTRLQLGVEAGGVATLSDWEISSNVGDIPSTPADSGEVRFINTSWQTNATWDAGIATRPLSFTFVNPRFPVDISGITFRGGSSNFVHYRRTYDATVFDGSNFVEGFPIRMYRSDLLSTDFEDVTDASGVLPSKEILIVNVVDDTTNTQYSNFQIRGYKYGFTPISGLRAIQDLNDGISEQILSVVDSSITEPDISVTLAYTEIETVKKFYDRYCAHLDRVQTTETERLVARVGDTIDVGSYDVVINQATDNDGDLGIDADDAFVLDDSTITINATAFSGSITTTGTVTDLAGVVQGGISDANGDSKLKAVGLVENQRVRTYVSLEDYNNDTNHVNEYIADSNGEGSVRYIFTGATFYIRAFLDDASGDIVPNATEVGKIYVQQSGIDNEINFSVGSGTYLEQDRLNASIVKSTIEETRTNVNIIAENRI
ncbi:hypothetical protein OAB00_01240 [Akkermansiaceae bacterium]|nr:hypothetical protein [Akkermansiaceae bacterium]